MKPFGGSSHSACEGLIYSDEKSGGGHRHADPGARGRSEPDIFNLFFCSFDFTFTAKKKHEKTRRGYLSDDCDHVTERSVLGLSDSSR